MTFLHLYVHCGVKVSFFGKLKYIFFKLKKFEDALNFASNVFSIIVNFFFVKTSLVFYNFKILYLDSTNYFFTYLLTTIQIKLRHKLGVK